LGGGGPRGTKKQNNAVCALQLAKIGKTGSGKTDPEWKNQLTGLTSACKLRGRGGWAGQEKTTQKRYPDAVGGNQGFKFDRKGGPVWGVERGGKQGEGELQGTLVGREHKKTKKV